ncbi:hypothetical protein BD626DRAFT_541596 [Schizophyllum amplum]|uniref:Zn(2)-C6 fungal-type domain-containing protein n=1 Tax=Schizophyllum amplum TaxID=97359 RepID=A0A550BTY2_9AGAR|nr:hypothetical protein BD626DRAFT_541596 [Auriculariopsis ampla]
MPYNEDYYWALVRREHDDWGRMIIEEGAGFVNWATAVKDANVAEKMVASAKAHMRTKDAARLAQFADEMASSTAHEGAQLKTERRGSSADALVASTQTPVKDSAGEGGKKTKADKSERRFVPSCTQCVARKTGCYMIEGRDGPTSNVACYSCRINGRGCDYSYGQYEQMVRAARGGDSASTGETAQATDTAIDRDDVNEGPQRGRSTAGARTSRSSRSEAASACGARRAQGPSAALPDVADEAKATQAEWKQFADVVNGGCLEVLESLGHMIQTLGPIYGELKGQEDNDGRAFADGGAEARQTVTD